MKIYIFHFIKKKKKAVWYAFNQFQKHVSILIAELFQPGAILKKLFFLIIQKNTPEMSQIKRLLPPIIFSDTVENL